MQATDPYNLTQTQCLQDERGSFEALLCLRWADLACDTGLLSPSPHPVWPQPQCAWQCSVSWVVDSLPSSTHLLMVITTELCSHSCHPTSAVKLHLGPSHGPLFLPNSHPPLDTESHRGLRKNQFSPPSPICFHPCAKSLP